MAPDTQQVYASMDPDDFSQGGGLFDDVDGTITVARFTNEPPDGYNAEGNPIFFEMGLRIDGADDDVFQKYSLGGKAGDNFEIADDGAYLVPSSPSARIVASSKFGIYMGALKQESFPISKLSGAGGMKNLVGTRAHFNRIADPERKGLQTGKKEKQYPQTTLCVSKIHALPGDEKASTGKASAKGTKKETAAPKQTAQTTAAPAAEAGSNGYNAVAQEVLLSVLAEANGSIKKAQLPLAVTRALGSNPKKADILKLILSEEFLNTGGPWKFADNVVTL